MQFMHLYAHDQEFDEKKNVRNNDVKSCNRKVYRYIRMNHENAKHKTENFAKTLILIVSDANEEFTH